MKVYLRSIADPTREPYRIKELPTIGSPADEGGLVYSSGFSDCVCMDQRGQTCGLYALAMILRKMNRKAIVATEADTLPVEVFPNPSEKPPLLQLAVQNGYTVVGEMFDPDDIVKLYHNVMGQTDDRCRVVTCSAENPLVQIVKEQLDRGGLVMIPYCNGAIRQSHWVVAVGYNEQKIVVISHGDFEKWENSWLMVGNTNIPSDPDSSCLKCQDNQGAEFCEACRTCRFSYNDVRPIETELRKYYGDSCPDFKEGWTGIAKKVSQLKDRLVLFDVWR